MPDVTRPGATWKVTCASAHGATHKRKGLPNQDSFDFWPESGEGAPLVVAVADGHGSARSFRSDVGAAIATSVAVDLMMSLFDGSKEKLTAPILADLAQEHIPKSLDREWRRRVEAHLDAHPITEAETDTLRKETVSSDGQAAQDGSIVAYGATLLITAVTEDCALFLQIGDGDVLVVGGAAVSRPLPGDDRLFATATTSLCRNEAWRDFRAVVIRLTNELPTLVMMATDGYSNSFRDEAAFLKAGSDIAELIRSGQWETVTNELGGWADDASINGSGDDITLAVLAPVL